VGVLPAVANTSAPTHTDGRQVALSVDTSGALRVTGISGGGGSVTEYTEDAAAAADPVGAMTMAVRADTPAAVTSTDGDNIALRATNKGEVYVKHVDAIPVTDNGGSLTVDGAVTVSGTATVSGSVSITGTATVAGTVTANAGTNLNTSALALETGGNLAKIPVAQASTTAGQSGPLIQGAVTTAAPTYTTAQTNPLSLTTAGALRVDASATTQPVTESSLVTDNAAFTDGTTKLQGAGFIFDETAGTALTENDMAAGRIDDKRAQVCVIEDTTTRGRRTTVTAANALKVDGSAVTQPVSGSVTSGHGKTILSTGGSASASGNNTILTADGSLKHKVCAFSLTTTSATAMTCIFQSGAGGTELWRCIIQAPSGANAGANLAVSAPAWLFSTAAATLLNLNLSSANAVHYSVSYFTEA
jgi:cytoskeletal protein CcmA (bactofilin family)